jgi:hypothetical protein
MQRVRCVAAGEQPVRRPCQPPVAAQDAEQLRRQHDIAILAALTLRDANHHPAAVDVGELETGHLGRTQPGGIRRGQRNAMLQVRHCLEEPHHLLGTEHHRQLAWFARIRDPLRQIGPTERGSIEEPQRTDDLVQPRPGDATGNQMQLECAHVLEAKLVGRAAKESTELRDRMHVGSLRRRRQVADRHVLDHPAAERAHIGHLGVSRLWGGLQPHDPGRWETAHLTIDGTSFQKRFSSICLPSCLRGESACGLTQCGGLPSVAETVPKRPDHNTSAWMERPRRLRDAQTMGPGYAYLNNAMKPKSICNC